MIDGVLDLSGFDAWDVVTLNTGHLPEVGGSGGPVGGLGGTGSRITDNSTPHGGHGFGTRNAVDRGGRGGETGYSISGDRNRRRPGGGGGGGGLALIHAHLFVPGATGRVYVNGGAGGRGENVLFFDSIGGNGGGGSGGFLALQALTIDLRAASDDAITALGGLGAEDLADVSAGEGDGGNGGPGVLQLHTPGGRNVLLPPGKELADLTSPDAHSLLPFLPVR